MYSIGENLNVINKGIGRAFKEMDPGPIREMAEKLTAAQVDFIDINLGPARKGGEELMSWVVKTVQEVTDIPLALDTSNIAAIEAGLKVHKGQALINSIMARAERYTVMLPICKQYEAKDIVACVSHADPIRLAVAYYIGLSLDMFQRLSVSPGSISVLWITDGNSQLLALNADPAFSLFKP